MTDDDRMRRLTVSLPAPLLDAVEDAVDEATERRDLPDLSKSEVLRYMVEEGRDAWDDSIETLVPDALIEEWRVSRERRRIKKRAYLDDLAGGWRGRVKSALNARLSGEEPYRPRHIRRLADGYREEAKLYFEDENLAENIAWLDDRVAAYIDAYRAKEAVPERMYRDVDDVEVGRDLRRLQEEPESVVETVEQVAESEAYDPDAILDRLSSDFGVDVEAVETLLDAITREDVDRRSALKGGDGFRTFVVDDALDAPDEPVEVETSRVESPRDTYDDSVETLTLTADDVEDVESVDLDGEQKPDIDPETLRDIAEGAD